MQYIDKISSKITRYKNLASFEPIPLKAKLFFGAAVLYLICPFDLIPDFIPVIGFIDDLIIVPYLLWLGIESIEEAKDKYKKQQKIAESIALNQYEHLEQDN